MLTLLTLPNLLSIMTTLYRKYRPQLFSDLAGQEHIVQTIMNEVAAGTVAHAYLFSGPRGVGKTTMARLLAKAVECSQRKSGHSEPCNTCSVCQEITDGHHIDVIEIDAASQTGVDNVRENIIDNAQFKPTTSPYKIFIIDEVHMLSTSAFNALLKTLEEPPAHVIFILATTELAKLPATIISRCQRFAFKRIGFDVMLETLAAICEKEKIKVDKDVLSRIIVKSEGGLRDAESLLGQIFSLNLKKVTANDVAALLPHSDTDSILTLLENLAAKTAQPALALVQTLVTAGQSVDQFMLDTLDVLRHVLVYTSTHTLQEELLDLDKEHLKRLKHVSDQLTAPEVVRVIDMFLRRRLETKTAPVPQLPLELLIVEWCTSPTANAPTGTPAAAPARTPQIEPTKTEEKPSTANISIEAKPEASVTPSITSTIKNAITQFTHGHSVATTLEQLQSKWNEVIDAVSTGTPSLTFILRMCRIKEVNHGGVILSVPYSLHKEKLEEPRNRRFIEEILEKKFAERIPLLCTVEAPAQEEDLSALASDFGGEVMV